MKVVVLGATATSCSVWTSRRRSRSVRRHGDDCWLEAAARCACSRRWPALLEYLRVVHVRDDGGSPVDLVLSNPVLLLSGAGWVVATLACLDL